jgi:predicted nucleic acid-binding protein
LIFADTNVVSETLRKTPDKHVLDWLIRFDAEIALPTVTIAEIAFGIHRIRTDQRPARLTRGTEDQPVARQARPGLPVLDVDPQTRRHASAGRPTADASPNARILHYQT